MIDAEELGRIIGRLAMKDEEMLQAVLAAAGRTDPALSPEDLDKLRRWAGFMRILREVVEGNSFHNH